MPDILIRGYKAKEQIEEIIQEARYAMNNSMVGSGLEIIELPAHGSLIDRDAIPYKKIMFDDDDFYYGVTQPYIDRMPVIVPASEEVADENEP